jgi:hypothetical protein
MTLIRTALILTIVTLICFLRPNAVGESSLFDKSIPEVLETTRLLYGNEGSAFSTLIQGLSEYTRKVDPQTSEEVKTFKGYIESFRALLAARFSGSGTWPHNLCS